MEYEISGENGFADVEVQLDTNEQIVAEPGAMISYTPGIQMSTDTGGGGLLDSAKRAALGGESLFMNTFTAQQPGTVTLAPPAPGAVQDRFLNNQTMYAQSGAFLAAEPNVEVDTEFQGASKFFRSGSTFLLKLSGTGHVFFDSYGEMERVELEQGEQFNIDSDHVVAFDSTVQYTTNRVGGMKSRAFGDEGKVQQFAGPGVVWYQNRDFESLAEKIAEELPGGGGGDDDGGDVGVSDFL
jgi:uncharacterized protein (TIGR00266 family)